MARLMVDSSDEDLPDLATLLKSKPQLTKSRSNETASRKQQSHRETSLQKTQKTTKESAITGQDAVRKTSPETLPSKPSTRRRILKPTTENPLLLPFSHRDNEKKRTSTKITQIKESTVLKTREKSPKNEIPRMRNGTSKTPELEPSSDDDVFGADIKGPNRGPIKEPTQPKRKPTMAKEALSRVGSRQATYKRQETSEDEEVLADGSSGMSDFVVEDEESLFEFSEDEEDSFLPSPQLPLKSARKLVRGRKPEREVSADKDIFGRRKLFKAEGQEEMNELGDLVSRIDIRKVDGNENGRDIIRPKGNGTQSKGSMLPPTRHSTSLDKQSGKYLPSSSFEHPSAILQFSPPRMKSPSKIKSSDSGVQLPPVCTPPASPSKNPLRSPKKPFTSIPPTPFAETADEFWAQDIMNDWVDKHSPKKEPSPSKPRHQPLIQSPSKSKMSSREVDTKRFKADFEKVKEDFASALLDDLDKTVTSGQLSKAFESSGGIKLQWSKGLTKTAGQAFYKHSVNGNETHTYIGRIELATKVVDDENRLLNTLAHEFCHLATFAISKQTKKPHGAEFQSWGRKVEVAGPGLVRRHLERDFNGFRAKWKSPRIEIKVSTCHSYEIDFKYEWQCTTPHCGIIYHRHSKSIKPTIHNCGKCKGPLIQIKPPPRKPATTLPKSSTTKTTKTTTSSNSSSTSNLLNPFAALEITEKSNKQGQQLNEYQRFVKDNMARIKAENPGSPHKDMMGLLSKSYREMKASKTKDVSGNLIPRFEALLIGEKNVGGGKGSFVEEEEKEEDEDDEDVFFDADEGSGEGGSRLGGRGKEGGVIDLVSDDEVVEEEDEDVFWT